MSAIAHTYNWEVIDVHSTHASRAIVRALAHATARTDQRALSPSGFGISLGEASVSTTYAFDELDLTRLLLEHSQKMPSDRGVFISVDEVQRIAEDDMENLGAAFQMSLRKGMPVMLVLAGLPGSKEKIASFRSCTFMQRAQEIEVGSLSIDETYEAFTPMLGRAKGISFDDKTVQALSSTSLGHPYLMQLLGYYLVERATERKGPEAFLDPQDVADAFGPSYLAYSTNVLEPSVARLGSNLHGYLRAAASLLDESRRASTSRIAQMLVMNEQQASSYRQRLIQRRLLAPAGWGYVRFCLPYLARYMTEKPPVAPQPEGQWLN